MRTQFRRLFLAKTFACLVIFSALVASAEATAPRKIALVIGNSAYSHAGALQNPLNDAVDMSSSLQRLGFEVIEALDVDKASMEQKIRAFTNALKGNSIALFFFAGHGLQYNGENFLLPVDAKIDGASSLYFEAIPLSVIQSAMEFSGSINIIFLDACRNNLATNRLAAELGTRGTRVERGLARVETGVGTLISFSTQPGNVALDGEGRNSPYAAALLKHMTSAEDLSSMLINVRNDVLAATAGQQVPWEHSALRARVFFGSDAKESAPPAAEAETSEEETAALAREDAITAPEGSDVLNSRWAVTWSGGPFCNLRTGKYPITVKNGNIEGKRVKGGKVSASGKFYFLRATKYDAAKTLRCTGRITGAAGNGNCAVINGNCTGTIRIERLSSEVIAESD
ncbi:MAG: caspase domain-containing protein [Hyphomicrobiales bacterium]|nr:caspase domain-containing protein [Hyphomicrobiales bacterium]